MTATGYTKTNAVGCYKICLLTGAVLNVSTSLLMEKAKNVKSSKIIEAKCEIKERKRNNRPVKLGRFI